MPEVWIALAEAFAVPALRLTTRDIADYDELMSRRLAELESHNIDYTAVTSVISELEPLAGAVEFLRSLRAHGQAIILSDTFWEFWRPMAPKLDHPTIFCNTLVVENNKIIDYRMRVSDGKRRSVEAFRALGFRTTAIGDSFNDLSMIRAADRGILFRPSAQVVTQNADLPRVETYEQLQNSVQSDAREV
jgi:phosphoserine/homoserine phosphotransferase